ncbi:molybdate transport system substrate-binding protein [Verrucomicrobium sp. GAS474]|uniref:molybdate ABC transporter substrate-binding protein n=1 Tax=Verrucomicrobium sp. GAS474 TaxID=1882831 RepID=UPI00087BB6BA|nr:molybdate ABC transporter substrate-binding protein [Verrucomicrobium sp. GAS474]SDU13268.1 molybdate transport system substrate-binding protein [Verrucomicrobium sp. GAS474]
MKMSFRSLPLLTSALVLLVALPSLRAAEITVFAASSLTESLNEIASAYQKTSGDKVTFNYGASGILARQIEEGAPADLFFSADVKSLVQLRTKNLVHEGLYLLSNTLVVVEPKGHAIPLSSAASLATPAFGKIAVGEPATVPVGNYAKEYLTRKNVWGAISGKTVPCANVRAVLAAVETANVDAGIVYRTDAAISKKVEIALEIPLSEGPNIVYPAAVVSAAKEPEAAQKFLTYLGGKEASEVFVKHGFLIHSEKK